MKLSHIEVASNTRICSTAFVWSTFRFQQSWKRVLETHTKDYRLLSLPCTCSQKRKQHHFICRIVCVGTEATLCMEQLC